MAPTQASQVIDDFFATDLSQWQNVNGATSLPTIYVTLGETTIEMERPSRLRSLLYAIHETFGVAYGHKLVLLLVHSCCNIGHYTEITEGSFCLVHEGTHIRVKLVPGRFPLEVDILKDE